MVFYSKEWVAQSGIKIVIAPILLIYLSLHGLVAFASTQVVIDYTYDDLDRLTIMRRADGPRVNYDYDEASNIVARTVANSPDFDGDLLADFADEDDDNDRIPDLVELAIGLDPFNSGDAALDLDGDGISNVAEYLQGSDISHKHGDLNADGVVDLGDLVLLKAIVFELQTATLDQQLPGRGDVNLNGGLDPGDVVILERIYRGY